jgi:GT2 family glycosyltransferase/glycosyltransferase involved in cell wall biosynthesis
LKIAVIVVNWNSGDCLRRCLESLAGQERRPDRVLVVDNASRDGSLDAALALFPLVEAIRLDANVGFAAANNVALRACTDCDGVALLNPDAFAAPSWLARLEAAAESHPDHASFASQMRLAGDPHLLDGAGDVYHVSGLVWRAAHGAPLPAAEEPRDIFSACAAAALYRRDALLDAGGFDERYFCYLEDVDAGFRLRLRGHRCLYVPDAVVHHVGSGTTGRGSDFSTYHGHRNLVWTWVKNMPGPLLALYLPQHLLLNLLTLAWFAGHGRGRLILKAKWDALRGLRAALGERRRVQRQRRAGAGELRRAMARGWLTPYLGRGRGPVPAREATPAPPRPTVPPARADRHDVLCLPIIDWDFRFQRPQQLMSQFAAAGHRVFYVSLAFRAAGDPWEIAEKRTSVYEVSLRGPARNVYTDALDDDACAALFQSLDSLRRDLALDAAATFVELPFWWPLARRAREAFAWPVVYDCMDQHAGFTVVTRGMLGQENALLASADLVVVSSAALERHARPHSDRRLLLRNACEYERFALPVKPPGQPPVVGYYGAIEDWLDTDLVADLAQRRPDWKFVLVGRAVSADVSRLSRLANVSLPGEQPYAAIPGWLHRFDVAIIPFKRTPLTEATNPVKAYEMLAAGKPIVSVPIPEMAALAPLVRLAATAEEMEREIAASLGAEEPGVIEARRAFAREHTWSKRFEVLAPAVRASFRRAPGPRQPDGITTSS